MLKIRHKNNKHSAVWLVEPKVSVGRAGQNEFVIDDPSVADHHVDIKVSHEVLTLVNVSGAGDVTINGKAIEQSSPLKADDILGIGKIELEIVDPKREQRPAPAAQSDKSASTGWALKANHTALSNRVFTIKEETIVGRSNECDITLAAAHLSRRHAKLVIQDGLLYIKDLGSANGTYLNGKRVVGEERLRRGDELKFDTLSFGVIGPAQDMDKTTVRQIPNIPAAAKPASSAGGQPKAAPTPVQTRVSNNQAARTETPVVGDDSGGSKSAMIWVVAAVVLVAGGVGFAFQQGLFG